MLCISDIDETGMHVNEANNSHCQEHVQGVSTLELGLTKRSIQTKKSRFFFWGGGAAAA